MEVRCEVCEKTIQAKPSHVAKGLSRFCSRSCFHQTRARKVDGRTCRGPRGYVFEHYRGRLKYQHIAVAEKALGKELPDGAEVHHWDRNRANNEPSNLVICQDSRYHVLLHTRAEIVKRGGNPSIDKVCFKCDRPLPKSMFWGRKASGDGLAHNCKECHNRIRRERNGLE